MHLLNLLDKAVERCWNVPDLQPVFLFYSRKLVLAGKSPAITVVRLSRCHRKTAPGKYLSR
jgi:hypothetical protein